jgi:hypothetical protein
MATSSAITISSAVEGLVDEVVMRRLLLYVGAIPGAIYGRQGKAYLRQHIARYNAAARHSAWAVLIDLDNDAACAPTLQEKWLASPAPSMCFRIAVRAVEIWLLADRQRFAQFLSIPVSRIPPVLEAVDDPKLLLINLARHSRKRAMREDMVPRQRSGRKVGPAYASRLMEFVEDTTTGWRPDVAAEESDSLKRCLHCLYRLVSTSHG